VEARSSCRNSPPQREDQVFVAAFLRSHGSIKEMEQVFGVSLSTIKARLNRISAQLRSSIPTRWRPAAKSSTGCSAAR